MVPLSKILHVPSVSASVNLATKFAVPPPSILLAVNGRFTHPVPPLVQIRLAIISPVARIFPTTSSFCVGVNVPIPTF